MNWMRCERAAERRRQRLDREGLREPGDSLDEAVPAREQAHHHPLDHAVLPDDHPLDLEQRLLEASRRGRGGGVG